MKLKKQAVQRTDTVEAYAACGYCDCVTCACPGGYDLSFSGRQTGQATTSIVVRNSK